MKYVTVSQHWSDQAKMLANDNKSLIKQVRVLSVCKTNYAGCTLRNRTEMQVKKRIRYTFFKVKSINIFIAEFGVFINAMYPFFQRTSIFKY